MSEKQVNKPAIMAAMVYMQANERGSKISYNYVSKIFGVDRRLVKYYVDKINSGKLIPDLVLSAEELRQVEEQVNKILEGQGKKEPEEPITITIENPEKLAEIEREKMEAGEELRLEENIEEYKRRESDIPLNNDLVKINPLEVMSEKTEKQQTPIPFNIQGDVAKKVYESLMAIEPHILLKIAGLAALRGYTNINSFIEYELLPWYNVKLHLEMEAGVRINNVKFIEAFRALVMRSMILDEIIKKVESVKNIIGKEKLNGGEKS